MGKRLIALGMARHPDIVRVLDTGTLAIIAGTTNGYVAEEVLRSIGQLDGFTREGFRRGIVSAPGTQPPAYDFPGDVIISAGTWQRGLTIFDVAEQLQVGDVVLKGGNAFDNWGKAAVLVGHPQGGTVLAATTAVVGRRVKLIVPIGLEKRVPDDVCTLAALSNAPDAHGPRLLPMLGEVFTEFEAIELLTGAAPVLLASGGVYGAEGAAWLGIKGTPEQVKAAGELIGAVASEPPCRV